MKRGQVTVFMIMGTIIIILLILLIIAVPDKVAQEPERINTGPVKRYIETCLQATAKEAAYFIEKHGGYYRLDDVMSTEGNIETAYYFYQNSNIMPSKERVQKEIKDYIDSNINFCLRNMEPFEDQGYDFKIGEKKSTIQLAEDMLIVTLDMPISMIQGSEQETLNDFFVEIEDINLGKMLEVASRLTEEQANKPNQICMSCIFSESSENDLYISMSNYDANTILFSILDNSTGEILLYANRYDVSENGN